MDIGTEMVRRRVIAIEDADDARILALRKERREKMLAEAAANPKPRLREMTWFRGRRTIVIG